MIYVWATLLVACNLAGLVLVLFQMPGNWLMVCLTVGLAWWQWEEGMFSVWTLAVIVLLALVGEVVEFVSSSVGVRKAGGSRWGGAGSLVGAIVGAIAGTIFIPIPIVGSLAGTCLGAFGGAWAMEALVGRKPRQSARAALGAGVGRLVGTGLKFLLGVLIWLIVAVAAFWP